MLPDVAVERPETVGDAVALLDDEHVPLGGGTELLLAMSLGLLRPQALVDLSKLAELHRLDVDGDELVIGAGVSHRSVHRSTIVRDRLPLLARVEEAVGNARVRAQGSIGGNLCFAEPKSDVATVLIALGASVVLAGPDGRRRITLDSFIDGPYMTVRGGSEVLVEVRVPLRALRGCYRKFQTMERPTVGVAAVVDGDRARVAVGAVGPVPVWRDFDSVDAIDVDAVLADVKPLEDIAGAADYKRHVTELYVRRVVAELAERAGEQS